MDNNSKQTVFDIIRFAIITLIIVLPIRAFVAQPFIVSGESMDPTYANGEYLIIDELSYHFNLPTRGEIIVFRYPKNPAKFFIKRIIGLPGETVTFSNSQITITPTDSEPFLLEETYLTKSFSYTPNEITLNDKEYFVMGDNREASLDSRMWGALEESLIKGRVLVRLLPVSKITTWPGYPQE